jgi:peroxiredoxin/predicted 2-oxoglutarate/Fe(II)-dependent dioxygenase YbiX
LIELFPFVECWPTAFGKHWLSPKGAMPSYKNLLPGDHAPWFHARATTREKFTIDTVGGRYIVLCFFATADQHGKAAVDVAFTHPELFDDKTASFFGVSIDPADEAQRRVVGQVPGFRFFWDFDGQISRLYGAIPGDAVSGSNVSLRRIWVVLDPTLRVLTVIPLRPDGSDGNDLVAYMKSLPPPSMFAGFEVQAPVLVLANVFEAEFCEKLITLHEAQGNDETGFMREVDGKTVQIHDHAHKRRRDHIITDNEIMRYAQQRFHRTVVPELLKSYQYKATRMERYLVGCYRVEDGGHFVAHRDNTTKGTAHRRFAVSVNLNSDFDGGEVSFPEYGPRGFKPPPGGAVVFSCSLLHAVSKVTRGRRYAFLPFLYDDEAAKIREANSKFLADDVGSYEPV